MLMLCFSVRAIRWTVGILSLVMLAIGFGELVVLCGFVILMLYGLFSDRRALRIALPIVACAGLVLHTMGFKIYGSPSFAPTQRLPGAVTLVALKPPSTLLLENGDSVELGGVYFPAQMRLDVPSSHLQRLMHILGSRSDDTGLQVRVDGVSGKSECLGRLQYWCGNTFFPSAFPRRLPRHQRLDLAEVLVSGGVALPSFEEFVPIEHPGLIELLDRSRFQPDSGLVSRGDERVIALGRELVKSESRYFVTGAYLLIAAQAVEHYPDLKSEALRRQRGNDVAYDERRFDELETVLAWVDPEVARSRLFEGIKMIGNIIKGDGDGWVRGAWILASHGELTAFDLAVQRLDDPRVPAMMKQQLAEHVPSRFQWPGNSRRFAEWYMKHRQELRSGRDEFGRVVVWLADGSAFDQRYRDSMDAVIRGSE
ncbi:MAG: hypothetical protein ACO1QR_11940 [Chthoniobacteraceae bacterium]